MKWTLLLLILALLPSCSSLDAGAGSGNANVTPAPKVTDATVVHKTIVVAAGKTFDGKGKAWKAGKELGDGSQKEGQDPLFLLMPAATLKNVIIAAPGADGVHIMSASGKTTTISRCIWANVGEDALTVLKESTSGDVLVDECRFYSGDDKIAQCNGTSTLTLRNCQADKFGRFARSNGAYGKTDQRAYRIHVEGGQFSNGAAVLKMSSPKAVGTVEGVKTSNVRAVSQASDGAKITVKE